MTIFLRWLNLLEISVVKTIAIEEDYGRHDLLVESYVDYYYSRKYGRSNCEWVDLDDFFDRGELAAKLYANYKFRPPQCVKKKLRINYNWSCTSSTMR